MITLLTNSHQSHIQESEYEIMYSSFKYHIQNFQVHNTHYNDVIMTTMASQITSLKMVYSTVGSVADHWPLWGEFTGDRWIPRTFHAMIIMTAQAIRKFGCSQRLYGWLRTRLQYLQWRYCSLGLSHRYIYYHEYISVWEQCGKGLQTVVWHTDAKKNGRRWHF